MPTHLAHVVMAVPDLEPIVGFYGAALGLAETGGGVDGEGRAIRRFRIGPTDLILLEDSEAVPYRQLKGSCRTEVDHFALYVDDAYAVFEPLERKGIAFRDKPHDTEPGHRNMQRSLVSFEDPFGFTLQLSQAIDPRPQLAPRIEAKKAMAGGTTWAGGTAGAGVFGGIDHVSTHCTGFTANRTLYRDILGLDEFFYSTSREAGAAVGTGFEQGAYAAGGSDIELASDDEWRRLSPGPVRGLGFQIDRIERVRASLRAHGVSFEEQPPIATLCYPGRPMLEFNSPDGMKLHILEGVSA